MVLTLFRKKFLMGIILLFFAVSLSGCVYVVVGTVGAVGGYVVSPDTVVGILSNRTYGEIWQATVEVVAIMGLIKEQNETAGAIISKIQGAKVKITLLRLSESAIKVTIKARKAFLPRIKIAQDVYVKIVNQLEE